MWSESFRGIENCYNSTCIECALDVAGRFPRFLSSQNKNAAYYLTSLVFIISTGNKRKVNKGHPSNERWQHN